MSQEGLPQLPHLAAEFYRWLWWRTEVQAGRFDLGETLGVVEVHADERLAFRRPGDTKVTAVLTGEDASTALESRAALAGGKVLEELRIRVRRDEREFSVSLKGGGVAIQRAKMPKVGDGSEDTLLYDRMFLYEELNLIVSKLFEQFAAARLDASWDDEVVPAMSEWIHGGE